MSKRKHLFLKQINREKRKIKKFIQRFTINEYSLNAGKEVILFQAGKRPAILLLLSKHGKRQYKFNHTVPIMLLVGIILMELSLPFNISQAAGKDLAIYPTSTISEKDFVQNSTVQANLQSVQVPTSIGPSPQQSITSINNEETLPQTQEQPPPVAYTNFSSNELSSTSTQGTTLPTPVVSLAQASNFDQVYKDAGAKYGVPWEILYGIHYVETGLRDGPIRNSEGSGAQGPMQFMSGTWRAYGVDGNGDGVADINSAVDAIYGAANFISQHGSIDAGLRAYGTNYSGALSAARSRGWGG